MQTFSRRIEGVSVCTLDGALAWALQTGGGDVIVAPGQCTKSPRGTLVLSLFALAEAFEEAMSVSTTGTVFIGRLA